MWRAVNWKRTCTIINRAWRQSYIILQVQRYFVSSIKWTWYLTINETRYKILCTQVDGNYGIYRGYSAGGYAPSGV